VLQGIKILPLPHPSTFLPRFRPIAEKKRKTKEKQKQKSKNNLHKIMIFSIHITIK